MTACSEQLLVLQAFADGELDAMASIALEAHLRACPACAAELERIDVVRAALRDPDVRPVAPAALRNRINAMMTPKAPAGAPAIGSIARTPARFSWAAFSGGGMAGALFAAFALFLAVPQLATPGLPEELVANHVRSLQAAHLVDVATSNRHVVKPWFNGRVDFAPAVPDLSAQGFPLVGGRLDMIDGRTVAAIVYKRSLHSINLFVRPAATFSSPIATSVRQGSYSLARWKSGGLEYWAVSDIDPSDLSAFRTAYRKATGS